MFLYFKFYGSHSGWKQEIEEYNAALKTYYDVREEYEQMMQFTSLENIRDLPEETMDRAYLDEQMNFWNLLGHGITREDIAMDIQNVKEETEDLLYLLLMAQQITNPTEEWVMERLELIEDIVQMQAVTKERDPNQLLGTAGGYTSCVYFSVEQVDQDTVKGEDIVEKGTDAGGAIEVYANLADAQNRCEYLGQFDNTLLYSGSYAIVGTMVIRTSYQLNNEQQMELTNKITTEFTAIKK